MNIILLTTFYTIFTLLAWRRLNWAVLFVIAALPSYLVRFRLGPLPMTLLEGMLIIIFIAAVCHRLKKVSATVVATRNYKNILSETFSYPLRASLTLPLGLFIVAATISLFIAPDLRAAAGIWKAYFIEPVLFFLVLLDIIIHHPKLLNRNQIISTLSISALLLSLYAIYQRFTGFGIPPPWNTELRVTSIFPYPNALGLFLAPLVPLFIAKIFSFLRHPERAQRVEGSHTNVWHRLLIISYWLLVTLASMLAIAFAKSTGALVGIAAGLALMLISVILRPQAEESRAYARAHIRGRFLAALGMTLLSGIALFVVLHSPSRNELLLRDWSGHVRRTQWSETWQMLKDTSTPLGAGRPILGVGLSGYQDTLKPYHKATYLEIFEYPHNIVLNFWSEIGLLGLVTFIWLIVLFFRKLWHKFSIFNFQFSSNASLQHSLEIGNWKLEIVSITAAMTALLVHGLVDVPYFKNDLAILFWIIYALGLASNLKPSE